VSEKALFVSEEPENILEQGVAELGLKLTREQKAQFGLYLEELKEWNKRINLTAITSDREVVVKHFLDSLSCLQTGKILSSALLVDLGSGAGFPGLPLKIALPSLRVTLLESSEKKSLFLCHIAQRLGLKNLVVVSMRAEEFARQEPAREAYDLATARAVSPLPVLLEYALPLLAVGGFLIAQKGRELSEELGQARRAATLLGGEIESVVKAKVPFLKAERHLVVIRKIVPTPEKYPRRTGIPSKRPLGR